MFYLEKGFSSGQQIWLVDSYIKNVLVIINKRPVYNHSKSYHSIRTSPYSFCNQKIIQGKEDIIK